MATKKVEKIDTTKNTIKEEAKERNTRKVEIPSNYEIPVRSNVSGVLCYVSKKNHGYEVTWNTSRDVEYIEFNELITMRNTSRAFFENNWVVIEDSDYTAQEVYKALSVDQYYKFTVSGIDDIFKLSDAQLKKVIPTLSDGFKANVVNRAKSLYVENSEVFDSSKKRRMFEELLNFKFDDDRE